MTPMTQEERAYYDKVNADMLKTSLIDREVKMMYEQARQAEILSQYLTLIALPPTSSLANEIEKFLDCWRLNTNLGLIGEKEFFDKVQSHVVKKVIF